MDPLTAALVIGGAATGAGISGLVSRAQERKLDRSLAGRIQQQQLTEAARRSATGQYGKSEAERRQDIREISEPARVETDRQLSLLSGLRRGGVGRSGAADKQATQLAKGLAQTQAEAGKAAAQISQKAAEQQKIADLALADREFQKLANRLAARRKARQEAAAFGAKLGSSVASDIQEGAVSTTEGSGVTK